MPSIIFTFLGGTAAELIAFHFEICTRYHRAAVEWHNLVIASSSVLALMEKLKVLPLSKDMNPASMPALNPADVICITILELFSLLCARR